MSTVSTVRLKFPSPRADALHFFTNFLCLSCHGGGLVLLWVCPRDVSMIGNTLVILGLVMSRSWFGSILVLFRRGLGDVWFFAR